MDWKDVVSKLAPTVATALLGPAGGVAVKALGSLLGLGEEASEDDVRRAMGQLTPEQISAIKQLEMKYQNDEKERGFRYAELVYKDVDSARKRDTALAAAGQRNLRGDILAAAAVIGFVVATIGLFLVDLPTANKEIIVYLLGALTVIVKDIYGFEFGGSKGSDTKNVTIADQSNQIASLVARLKSKSEQPE